MTSQDTTIAPNSPISWWCEPPIRPKWYGTTLWLHKLRFDRSPHTMTDSEIEDLLKLHTLPFETRLDHDNWQNNEPVEDFAIDATIQYSIMQQGLDIAKQTVWHFLAHNEPRKCRSAFPGGWVDVQFGRQELADTIGEKDAPDFSHWRGRRLWAYRQNQPEMVHATIYHLIDFRNAICHFSTRHGWHDLLQVDRWLKTAQRLAIQFYDKERALEVRCLRDQLRKAVADATADIEALEPLCLLPFAGYPWDASHEVMFERVTASVRYTWPTYTYTYVDMFDATVPAAVVRVAVNWTREDCRRDPVLIEEEYKTEVAEPEQHQRTSSRKIRRRATVC